MTCLGARARSRQGERRGVRLFLFKVVKDLEKLRLRGLGLLAAFGSRVCVVFLYLRGRGTGPTMVPMFLCSQNLPEILQKPVLKDSQPRSFVIFGRFLLLLGQPDRADHHRTPDRARRSSFQTFASWWRARGSTATECCSHSSRTTSERPGAGWFLSWVVGS